MPDDQQQQQQQQPRFIVRGQSLEPRPTEVWLETWKDGSLTMRATNGKGFHVVMWLPQDGVFQRRARLPKDLGFQVDHEGRVLVDGCRLGAANAGTSLVEAAMQAYSFARGIRTDKAAAIADMLDRALVNARGIFDKPDFPCSP